MNNCTFSGCLAADPELKTVGSNDLLSFRIPVDDGFGEPRAMRASEQEKARAELRRIAKDRVAEAADVRRVLAFVAGVRG